MAIVPTFKLYDNTGLSLIYTFEKVTNWDNPFRDPKTFTEHLAVRGQGSHISEGSLEPWDLNLEILLLGNDYEDLADQMNSLPNTIAFNTQYILKIDLDASTTKDLKVKRLLPIEFPIEGNRKVITYQRAIIPLRVLTWA